MSINLEHIPYLQAHAKILIVGLGASGQSVASYLAKRHLPFEVADSRVMPPSIEEFKALFEPTGLLKGLYLGEFEISLFCRPDISLLIVSPGVPLSHPAIQQAKAQGKIIIGDIELFAQEVKIYCPSHQIIGITGSNGKSTVTTLVGELLKINKAIKVVVAGNIGLPVLTALDNLIEQEPGVDKLTVYFVLELSSFQLETTYSLELAVATILNISPNHLDRYRGSLTDYSRAKQLIYVHAQKVVSNREDMATYPTKPHKNLVTFGLDRPQKDHFGLITENDQMFLACGQEKLWPVSSLKLIGRHNYANILTALAIIKRLNMPLTADLLQLLTQFTGLPHRCQWVANINEVQWINDSKGTSIGATIATIKGLAPTLKGKIILIAGGDSKGADFSELTDILKSHVKAVVLIGRDASKIAEIIPSEIVSYYAQTIDKAVPIANELAKPGETVLLSPVCASWDQYSSYIARGDHFISCVLKLSNGYNDNNS